MHRFRKSRRLENALLLIGFCLSASACTGPTSVDQAYYTGGDAFAFPGGYTRTIFSTSNF